MGRDEAVSGPSPGSALFNREASPAALDEIDRCLEGGMIGVKLYNQIDHSDPIVFPVAERCIAHGIPLLGHSGHVTDARPAKAAQPQISDSHDFCMLSGRYPELSLILGHVNGGGDWEWAIKALRDCPNVYVDTEKRCA
ncbi:MAG: amidohydrolase family protein [Pirellulaceae bacterium]